MIELAPREAYRLWSSGYEHSTNPLLALEMRVLRERLHPLTGRRVIDIGAGTGRWTSYAEARGASVIGLDLSPDMLAIAARKTALAGRLVVSDMSALPILSEAADLALCSFALGYVPCVNGVMAELARIARRVIVSDLHPDAVAAGWSRSFRAADQVYCIRSYRHSLNKIERAARTAGLQKVWELEARFGAPEEQLFQDAGKKDQFVSAQQVPAIYARCWERS